MELRAVLLGRGRRRRQPRRPYIDAAPLEEQKYFLTTQQVDEARHAVFFKRFMHEVAGIGDGTMAGGLEAIKPELTWGFRKVFDRLDTMADELRKDRSRPKLAAAITLYHVIIEAGLAQSGQHFITSYLADRDLLPGFREGMENVARDEQRHIGFGVKLLHDLVAEDPRCREAVADTAARGPPVDRRRARPARLGRELRHLLRLHLRRDRRGGLAVGRDQAAQRRPSARGSSRPAARPARSHATWSARAAGASSSQAGVLGEKNGPPAKDPEAQELLFDTIRRSVNPEHGLRSSLTVQWDFPDADPWYVVVDNGSSRAEQGRAPAPDVTLRSSWEDFVDLAGGRLDPRRAVLTRRLRLRGRVRALLAFPRVFGR